jgi:hypothetical protein
VTINKKKDVAGWHSTAIFVFDGHEVRRIAA